MNKEISIDDVIEFIEKYGAIYDYKIYKALEKLPNPKITPKEATSKRANLYERLSKL